jgi:hypothetical protein
MQDSRLTKKRGRPPGATHTDFIGFRWPSEITGGLDSWAADQREPMSRSEALRTIVTRFLRSKAYLGK